MFKNVILIVLNYYHVYVTSANVELLKSNGINYQRVIQIFNEFILGIPISTYKIKYINSIIYTRQIVYAASKHKRIYNLGA